ncbi:MAG: hypothetical protein K1Y36_11685 [Blastocatellia bacterium]|nr:hypothetical protein [Blastocatellia bacterium]
MNLFRNHFRFLWCLSWLIFLTVPAAAQKDPATPLPPVAPAKNYKQEKTPDGKLHREYNRDYKVSFAYGRSLMISTPPTGSLFIEGWNRREISVQAKFAIEGSSDADLDALMNTIGFGINQDGLVWNLVTVGPQMKLDKKEKERLKKGLPPTLQKLPYRIDYTIKVPEYTDLEINHNEGEVVLESLYSSVNLTSQKGKVVFSGLSGTLVARIVTGEVQVFFGGRSWRGNGIDLQMGVGNISLTFPSGYNTYLALSSNQPLKLDYPIVPGDGGDPNAPVGNAIQTQLGGGGGRMKFSTQAGQIRVQSAESGK